MNKQYENELEASLYYANKEIDKLKQQIIKLQEEKEYIKQFIEQKCVYDNHLMGYCFDLKKGDVRRLMYKLNNSEEKD